MTYFQHTLKIDNLVIELDDKAFCLLFHDILSVLKEYNTCPIKLHNIPNSQGKQESEKLQHLKQSISSQQNFITKVNK